MVTKNKLGKLEKTIVRFYQRYTAKRVVLATFLVGFFSLGGAFAVYWIFGNGFFAAIAGFFVGFVGIHIAFVMIIPSASSLNKARSLIYGAIKDPSRIKSYDRHKVQLADSQGKVVVLGAREMGLWKSLVVPYFIQCQAQREKSSGKRSRRTLEASVQKYNEQRRKEVLEMEKKIEAEQKSLDQGRRELEVRGADLKQAEEMVISRLNGLEQAEAEIEQLKIVAADRADVDAAAYDAQAEAKAAELRAKEHKLSDLKERLANDRQSIEKQKVELQRLQTEAGRTPFAKATGGQFEQSIEAREAALEARIMQLEDEAHTLDERSSFVTDTENSLIARLDALSHREAMIEQGEIDAGLLKD
ncbi:MAG: hypothetical protein ACI9ZV_000983 [Candidatus Azotimanducaceae bacterium]|jgi:hypothetical protein